MISSLNFQTLQSILVKASSNRIHFILELKLLQLSSNAVLRKFYLALMKLLYTLTTFSFMFMMFKQCRKRVKLKSNQQFLWRNQNNFSEEYIIFERILNEKSRTHASGISYYKPLCHLRNSLLYRLQIDFKEWLFLSRYVQYITVTLM